MQSEPLGTMLEHWAAAKPTRNHAAECENLRRTLAKAPSAIGPEHPGEAPDTRPQKGGGEAISETAYLQPGRCAAHARYRPVLSVPACAAATVEHLHTMLLLAYCAGLRRSELARLDLATSTFNRGTITIRETKFFKTRILPLPDTVMAELRGYLDARRRAGASQDPQSGLFWHNHGNGRYAPVAISLAVRRHPSPRRIQTTFRANGAASS